MSLRTRIQDLRTSAAVADDEDQVRTRTGQLAEFSKRLAAPATDLPALNVALAELEQIEADVPAQFRQDATQAVEGLRAFAAELTSMSVDASLDLAKVWVRAAEKFPDGLREFVTATWQQHLDQPLPPVNEDLVDALARGGVDVEAIRVRLEGAQTHILAVKSRALPAEGDADKFSAALESLRACGEEIGEVVDPDIAEGILGTQSVEGMPLAWFTPARLQAISTLGIVDRFRVHLR